MKVYEYFENMAEENISSEIQLKNRDETRNYFLEEIEQNKLMCRKHEKVCTTLNYIEYFLILVSIITGYISFSNFCFWFFDWYSNKNYEYCKGLKSCPITTGIKTYKSIIRKKKKKHDKVVLLTKSKLNSAEVLNSKGLFD